MSIVYEALQKARKQREKKPPKKESAASSEILDQLKQFEQQERDALYRGIAESHRKRSFPTISTKGAMVIFLVACGVVYFVLSQSAFKSDSTREVSVDLIATKKTVPATSVLTGEIRSSNVNQSAKQVVPEKIPAEKVFSEEALLPKAAPPPKEVNHFRKILVQRTVQIPEFRCTGIMEDVGGDYCFLNGLIAREGDVIDGARILQIGKRGVLLDYKGTRLEVPLPEI